MRDWLKEARTEKNLTMAQMAAKLEITESYYSLIESGERQKKMDMILAGKIAAVFGMPLTKIAEMEGE